MKMIEVNKNYTPPPPSPLLFLAVCYDGKQVIFMGVKAKNSTDARLKVEAMFVANHNDPSKVTIDIHIFQPIRDVQILGYHNLKITWY